MDEIKQSAKGENINQNTIIVQGDYHVGINRDGVIELIKSFGYVNKDEIIDIVQDAIEHIPEGQREMPDKRIFVPAIQQLSYSTDDDILKNAYKNLLSSSMHSVKKINMHPSFITIISQLNSDEIKLLNSLPCTSLVMNPVINMRMKIGEKKGLGITQVKYFSDIGYGVCEYPEKICVYLENLERLNLIEIPNYRTLTDKSEYEKLKNHPAILAIKNKNFSTDSFKITYEFDEMYFNLTTFGQNFIECCKS